MDLNLVWFILLGILLVGYAILDGFDLGVGIIHYLAKTDHERRILLNSIGPLWDGNEVWLVTFGGALFAAFPDAYATAFSSFYIPFMLLLWSLIFRAVSIEFRSKAHHQSWRNFWDFCFFLSSLFASFLYGVAIGNSMAGLPIGQDFEFQGHFSDLFSPYSILVGLLTVVMFAMHGSFYLNLKTEGELQKRLTYLNWTLFGLFLTVYILTTIVTLVRFPHATHNFESIPIAWFFVIASVLAIANIPRSLFHKSMGQAFASSCATILTLVCLFGLGLFPNLIRTTLSDGIDITIYNAASSQKTLGIMFVISLIGMPFVVAYTTIIYWVFRGKTRLDSHSY